MIRRYLPHAFFLLAALAFGAAIYAYFQPADGPGAAPDQEDYQFPALAIGLNDIRIRVHNPTQHPVRVVGYRFC
jgi:hypothetical protein